MEEALRLPTPVRDMRSEQGFNPCFNGRGVKTVLIFIIGKL